MISGAILYYVWSVYMTILMLMVGQDSIEAKELLLVSLLSPIFCWAGIGFVIVGKLENKIIWRKNIVTTYAPRFD